MFNDGRGKSVVFVAHCILNQNAISDGTATHSGSVEEIVRLLLDSKVGIVQMPCPELHCLGLDRGDVQGAERPVLRENTRIRAEMIRNPAARKLRQLGLHVLYEIMEYCKHGFEIMGIIGMNRSPNCGVETTSKNNREEMGPGLFIETLQTVLAENDISIKFLGIKAHEMKQAVMGVQKLLSVSEEDQLQP